MTNCEPNFFGADPANITWQVVRGDTAELKIEFYENDEVTPYDTTGWTYAASAYDFKGDVTDELTVEPGVGYATIIVEPDISQLWGEGFRQKAGELAFDLQVTVDSQTVWTPVIGTISVIADVTAGGL
jgi:hypothetical protein